MRPDALDQGLRDTVLVQEPVGLLVSFTQPAVEQTPLDQLALTLVALAVLLLGFIAVCLVCEYCSRRRR